MRDDFITMQSQYDVQFKEIQDHIQKEAKREAAHIEGRIEMAVLNGYDGIDVNHDHLNGIVSLDPWNLPKPDADNGYHTERYSWYWFDRENLQEIVRNGDVMDLLDNE